MVESLRSVYHLKYNFTYSKNLSLATRELSFLDMLVIFAYSIYSTEKIRYLAIGG